MPTIIERNGKYLARVRKDGFKPTAKTFGRKSDAKAWGLKVEADMQAGRWVEAAAEVPTLRDALKTYRTKVADKFKGADSYAYVFDQWQSLPLASKFIDTLTPVDLASWRDDMAARGLAAGTVARRMGLMSGFLSWCRTERGWLTVNPMSAVRKPRVNDERDRVLSPDERAYLLAAAGTSRAEWLSDVLVVLLRSAMRRGELWGLTVGDADFSASVARLADTKNGTARDVPLCSQAVAALRRLVAAAKARADDASHGGAAREAPGSESLVPVSDPHAVSLAFRRTLARAHASYLKDCANSGAVVVAGFLVNVRLHDLRHCAVTTWASTGALSLPELMAVSGHKTPRMLMRYVNLSASTLAEKMSKVGT